jgi:hypothetical protein
MPAPRARSLPLALLASLVLLVMACAGHARPRTGTPGEVDWCSVEEEAAGRCQALLKPEPVFVGVTAATGSQ